MKPFTLEAQHMVPVNETAFPKDASTKLMRDLIKEPEAVIDALQNTSVRFSLIPQKRRAVRLG
jgi:hypothetical protein